MDEMETRNVEISRMQAEEISVFAIYDLLLYAEMGEPADVPSIVSGLCETPFEECDVFIKRMILSFLKYHESIQATYQERMLKWRFDRLNKLEQALLFQAYCHFYHDEQKVNKAVVIDYAVRFAKKYLSENDYKFVNGILDKVLTDA